MIIGSLGVLDDLVFENSMRTGRNLIAATVKTLVLAYTGASLSLLLLFTREFVID